MQRVFHILCVLLTSYATNGFAAANLCQILLNSTNAQKIPTSTSQVLVVHATTGFNADIMACQRSGKTWHPLFASSIKGVIGTNGLAAIGEKKEGDRKTPAGIYPIGDLFGSKPLAVQMDFRFITPDDKFVDDVGSPFYNTWINGPTEAKSYELMRTESYRMGAVVNYNMNPIVPGAGSAIFIHLKGTTPNYSTAGCIAMDEKSLSSILHWFDKKQRPYVFIE